MDKNQRVIFCVSCHITIQNGWKHLTPMAGLCTECMKVKAGTIEEVEFIQDMIDSKRL